MQEAIAQGCLAMPDANSLRKAAILLVSLPEEEAARLLAKLTPQQAERVSLEIAQLRTVPPEEQERVILEFAESKPRGVVRSGGLDVVQSLLERALGRQAADTIDNIRQVIESLPFGFLRKVDPQNIATFLAEEHPQTIALVLSHLPAQLAAQVLSALPVPTQLSVVRRVAHMGQTSPEVLKAVEEAMANRLQNMMHQSAEKAGGVEAVARILNVADRTTERTLLDNLAQEDPELAAEIRRLMFVFEDIAKLSDKDIQTLLKHVETAQWAMALKGASEELRQKILGNMSQRAAAMLMEEIEFLGPKRLSEVEAVQQQIVDIVRQLEDQGEITTQPVPEDQLVA
ncbi:MAG: flagellar motor switch protein FliG [Pirellulaceae bacterium]|nr:MAG: flagellar motor switch protein FliG [Pirellulaceae bacterium]